LALEIDLSKSPYYDDYSPDKHFHRVLVRPAIPVQARELTTSQTIMQDQIERFGRHIFKDGSIVEKCELYYEPGLQYVKLGDTYANGYSLTVADLVGKQLRSDASGLRALVTDSAQGATTSSPDLNTVYIDYLNSGNDYVTKTFAEDEVLTVYTTSNVAIGQVSTANAAVSGNSAYVGYAYKMAVSGGTVFQKGFFIGVEPQSIVVTKYHNRPDKLSVGFHTVESIVTPEEDPSLLDNAAGSENYGAPGAHRLRLTPTLVVRDTSNTTNSNTEVFFALADFVEGAPSRAAGVDPAYAALGDELAKRTNEESGDYIIEPFNMRALPISGNNTHLKLELDPGLAYIKGYRVKTVGKLVSSIRKSDDIRQIEDQVVSATVGSYVYATEYAGLFDFPTIASVSLRSANAQVVTTALATGASVDSVSAPGSEIGTAKIIGAYHDSGSVGLPSTTYRMYLTDIVMAPNTSFSSVRSLYSVSGGAKGFADLVLESNNAILKDSSLTPLIYDLGTDHTRALISSANTINAQFDFRTASNVTFAVGGTATLSVPSHVGGTNKFPYGVGALDSTSENDFMVVVTSNAATANLAGRVSNTSANTVGWTIGQSSDFTSQYSVGEHVLFLNATASEVGRVTAVTSSSISLANNLTYAWSNSAHAKYYPVGYTIPFSSSSGRSITISSATSASLALGETFTGSFNSRIYYNVRRTNAVPAAKTLNTSVFVKINTDTHTNGTTGPWSLGLPDTFLLKHVYVGSGTYANTNPDRTSLFSVDPGQKDTYYGLSRLTKSPTYALPANASLLVEVMCFAPDTSQGVGYFSVDSFDIDDSGNSSSNSISTQYVPSYTSASSGKSYSFRDSVDFRQYAVATAAYAANASSATTNPNGNNSLSVTSSFFPVVDSTFESDVQYYLGRKDVVGLTPEGSVVVVEGTPSERPIEPHKISSGISLSYVTVPPYPSLTSTEARDNQSGVDTIQFTPIKNRRYTMSDIGKLDDRISVVEYYTSLSLLEQSTKSLLLESETGGDRFKNGIIADPFNGHDIGNVTDPDYNIAMDSATSEARPIVTQKLVQMKYDSATPTSSSIYVSDNGKLVILGCERVENPYLFQMYATQLRNPSQDIAYRWVGTVNLTPEGDYTPDVTVNPDVTVGLDLYSNFKYLYDRLNLADGGIGQGAWVTQYGTWRETGTTSTTDTSTTPGSTTYSPQYSVHVDSVGWYYVDPATGQKVYVADISMGPNAGGLNFGWKETGDQTVQFVTKTAASTTTTVTTSVDQTRTGIQSNVQENTTTYSLGSYVTDVALQPFIKAQAIYFGAVGLKPSTRMWMFFDDDAISQYCAQLTNGVLGPLGGPFVTDELGSIEGWFFLPSSTFRTGERKFRILDISDLVTETTILRSSAEATFYGTNLSYAKNNINLEIKDATVYQKDIQESRTVVSSVSTTTGGQVSTAVVNCKCYGSPCAQSFIMPEEKLGENDISGVYIAAMDLFFSKKHETLGLTVMIREMENGYPAPRILPYGSKHLTSDDVLLSDDATLATTVVFEAPVFLESKKEYCIVVKADGFNPDYAMWTAALGGDPDVTLNVPVYHNSFVGNFFTSSTDTGWTAYQQEDLKIAIYRLTFTTLDAVASFVNEDWEFLKLNSQLGTFMVGEQVYFANTADYSNGVYVESGNTTIGLSSNAGFSANDKIYVLSNTNVSAFVANVVSVGSNTITVNATPDFSDADCEIGHLRNSGQLYGSLYEWVPVTGEMTVANSTATGASYVIANTRVIGAMSNASANVALVDDLPYNVVMPKLATSVPHQTALTFSFKGSSNTYVYDTAETALEFANDRELRDYERLVLSRSNELAGSYGKSLRLYAHYYSNSEKTSPAIDMNKCGMHTVRNIINADAANNYIRDSEKGNGGYAIDRYISRAVVLADGQDAEDIKILVAAYQPASSKVLVYARIQHYADPDLFTEKPWTLLETGTTLVSSRANAQDFIEYEYGFPTVDPGDGSAWCNPSNYGIVQYEGADGQVYEGYKVFAVKIVLLSSDSAVVPRLQDMRGMALQQ